MTQRQEVRFKVYTKTSTIVTGNNTFPLELIDFLEGDGTYDTSTYKYNVQNAGTYLLGLSYNKQQNSNLGTTHIRVDRVIDGVNTTTIINRSQLTIPVSDTSFNVCIMYRLEVGDEIYCAGGFGGPKTNINTYTSDDTLNSFWGIRMDY
jgi:hypothetical protein